MVKVSVDLKTTTVYQPIMAYHSVSIGMYVLLAKIKMSQSIHILVTLLFFFFFFFFYKDTWKKHSNAFNL